MWELFVRKYDALYLSKLRWNFLNFNIAILPFYSNTLFTAEDLIYLTCV